MPEAKRRDIYLVRQFKVRICLDQIPVSKAVLINAKQEQNVVLLIPVHVEVGNLDPAGQFKPAANTDLSYLMCDKKQRAVLPLFREWDLTCSSPQGWPAPLCAEARTLPRAG